MWVYDLKARKELGRSEAFDLALTPSRAMFYALSPEALNPVALKAAATVSRGEVQRVAISSALPEGRQAVRVQVKLPNGDVADWVRPVAVADRQGATVDIPVALNDPPGTWTISATDVCTGKVTTAEFEVSP